uniref:Uncharacterized protein n=1 Tax=mine drainage metagenome TaxID=410659 RepID=E6QV06_9ZZZZ
MLKIQRTTNDTSEIERTQRENHAAHVSEYGTTASYILIHLLADFAELFCREMHTPHPLGVVAWMRLKSG